MDERRDRDAFDPQAMGLEDLAGVDIRSFASQNPTEEEPATDNTADPSGTVRRQVQRVLGVPMEYTLDELAEEAGVSREFASTFWKAMGFPATSPGSRIFGSIDVKALADIGRALDHEHVDEYTAISLLRAQSHTMDRLVLWQVEALVEHLARTLKLDDTSARLVLLDRIDSMIDLLAEQVTYSWRRQMAGLLWRTDAEVSQSRRSPDAPWRMPLLRGVGFVDMVAYTRRSAELGTHALAELIQGFEFTARDVITGAGARIVKTIGDSVLFVADDLPTIVEVTIDLVEALGAKRNMLPVRAGVVWGGVLSRSGDIFGPTVNLASRLSDVAPAGGVLTDSSTADALADTPEGKQYTMVRRPDAELQGLGTVTPIELRRLPSSV